MFDDGALLSPETGEADGRLQGNGDGIRGENRQAEHVERISQHIAFRRGSGRR